MLVYFLGVRQKREQNKSIHVYRHSAENVGTLALFRKINHLSKVMHLLRIYKGSAEVHTRIAYCIICGLCHEELQSSLFSVFSLPSPRCLKSNSR
jgi:hypothetical protein